VDTTASIAAARNPGLKWKPATSRSAASAAVVGAVREAAIVSVA
jgi:hypothetical protein